jgi:hypothetical protein
MAAAHLSALSPEEKTAVLNALKRVLSADHLSHARRTAQRICALERVIARLEAPDPPLELDEAILLFESILAAARGEKPTTH